MQPVVLIYHMNEQKASAISALCSTMKIRAAVVLPGQEMVPVGLLTGAEDPVNIVREAAKRAEKSKAAAMGELDEEMIVMSGFTEKTLRLFLDSIRQNGLPVSLKAVETDENRFWSGRMLSQELKKERQAIQGGRQRI